MESIIVFAVIVGIVGAALTYIRREKKRGVQCIGCPDAGHCSGGCTGCPGQCNYK